MINVDTDDKGRKSSFLPGILVDTGDTGDKGYNRKGNFSPGKRVIRSGGYS